MKLKNSIKKYFAYVGLLFMFNFFVLATVPSLVLAQEKAPAQSTNARCDKYKAQFQITSTDDPKKQTSILGDTPVFCSAADLLLKVINYILIISGTVTILFLMIGGFFYLTSAGAEEQTEKGKKILINSVIGLVVIVMSFAIVRIVSSLLSLGK